jgi:hypothetical protein
MKEQISLRLIFRPAAFTPPAGVSPLSSSALQVKKIPRKYYPPFHGITGFNAGKNIDRERGGLYYKKYSKTRGRRW